YKLFAYSSLHHTITILRSSENVKKFLEVQTFEKKKNTIHQHNNSIVYFP
ncbi:unnamed protein product, partial [Schistosoma intercalatum]